MENFELLPISLNSDSSIAICTVMGEPIALIVSGREMAAYKGKLDLLVEYKLSRMKLLLGLKALSAAEPQQQASAE